MNESTELTRLGVVVGNLIGNIAGFAVMVMMGWLLLKVIITGGDQRAFRDLVIRGLLIGVAVAMIANLGTTVGIVTNVGSTVFGEIGNAVRASFQ